mgnify:CR=1 FL=1
MEPSGISSLEFVVLRHFILQLRLMNTSPFSISEITLPEYSTSSNASTAPPLLFNPFYLVQNNLEQRIGLSSASNAPASVNSPCSFTNPNEIFTIKAIPYPPKLLIIPSLSSHSKISFKKILYSLLCVFILNFF